MVAMDNGPVAPGTTELPDMTESGTSGQFKFIQRRNGPGTA